MRVPITAGELRGTAFWDPELSTFAVTLEVFDDRPPDGDYPPATVRYGTRCAEFVTADALVNHLITTGLAPDEQTLATVDRFGRTIAGSVGEAEFVGLTAADASADRHLYLRLPLGGLLAVNPRLAHPDHRHDWGNTGPATVETARQLCELAFLRRPGPDVDAFALALTYEFLGDVPADFSVSASAVCDWFLTDSEPTTTIDPVELTMIRAAAGLA